MANMIQPQIAISGDQAISRGPMTSSMTAGRRSPEHSLEIKASIPFRVEAFFALARIMAAQHGNTGPWKQAEKA